MNQQPEDAERTSGSRTTNASFGGSICENWYAGDANAAGSSGSRTTSVTSDITVGGPEEDDDGSSHRPAYAPGPPVTLRDHLERDKDDDSLTRWKKQLLGSVDLSFLEDKIEPEVTFQTWDVLDGDTNEFSFTFPDTKARTVNDINLILREGTKYTLKFTFTVRYNILSGLVYLNSVRRAGFQVHRQRCMLGTFSPQTEPYTQSVEELTPCGIFARGFYSAKIKFIDDDGRKHFEINYSMDLRKG